MAYIRTEIVEKDREISLDLILREMIEHDNENRTGGIGLFVGIVKGSVQGSRVLALEYSSIKEVSEKKLFEIASQVSEKYGLNAIIILHRIGNLEPGEITLVIVASAETRKKVMPALAEALERVKHEVPIFKLEHRIDGKYWIIGDSTRIAKK